MKHATNTKNFEMDFKVSSQSIKFEFNVFSKTAIISYVLDRFQENKAFQRVQLMNNIF